jgi:hypothetical protein
MSSQLTINANTDLKLNKAILIRNNGKKIIKKTISNKIIFFKKRIHNKTQNGQNQNSILQTLPNQVENEITQVNTQSEENEIAFSKDYKNFLKLEKRKRARNTYHMYLCLKFNNFEMFLTGIIDSIPLDERCLQLLNDNFEYYSLIDNNDFYWKIALSSFDLKEYINLYCAIYTTTFAIK